MRNEWRREKEEKRKEEEKKEIYNVLMNRSKRKKHTFEWDVAR